MFNTTRYRWVDEGEDFRFDASRLKKVIEVAAEVSGWGTTLPGGKGRGIAASYNQGAWVAQVAEVTVGNGRLSVDRIICASVMAKLAPMQTRGPSPNGR